jgi:rhodanese-related sulfurtransferase
MKKISLYLIGLLLIPTLFLTSCDRGDDVTQSSTPSFTLMKDYMTTNNLDLNNILTSPDGVKFVVGAPDAADLNTFLAKYYIMDIRSATDFANGHIEGAINVAFSNILTDATNAGSKPILVVCYTGQTACYGTALLRLYGYSNTQALKWGMSGWNSSTAGSWNNNIGDPADGNANWTYSTAPANLVFSSPTITSFSTDGAQILKERVEQVVADGFKSVSVGDILASPSQYFINNYFSATDYQAFGHVANAYRINPLLLSDNSYLGLDPGANAKVATYCYTGQTSAVITACLRVLGYDAYSITFGMNGFYNSNDAWVSNKWTSSVPKDLPLVN